MDLALWELFSARSGDRLSRLLPECVLVLAAFGSIGRCDCGENRSSSDIGVGGLDDAFSQSAFDQLVAGFVSRGGDGAECERVWRWFRALASEISKCIAQQGTIKVTLGERIRERLLEEGIDSD